MLNLFRSFFSRTTRKPRYPLDPSIWQVLQDRGERDREYCLAVANAIMHYAR